MIGSLARVFDNLLGRGEAAVTVPPLDGAFRPNRRLDEASDRIALENVDCLVSHGGEILASARGTVFRLDEAARWTPHKVYGPAVACLASVDGGGLAVALEDGNVVVEGGRFEGRSYRAAPDATCITAMAVSGTHLLVANGSAVHGVGDWQRDLLERNASGSIWRIDLESGRGERLADGLAWPAGLAPDGDGVVYSEAWRHRLMRLVPGRRDHQPVHVDLPGYPGRISPAAAGHWLCVFAPRSQLVEFVLRETAYRKRMMAEVPQQFWVSPKLRSGRSFYETLQGGGVKQLGMLKPWAPAMSSGLCVALDAGFQPRASLQSRADGATHGVTSAIEHQGRLYVGAQGDGVVVSLALAELEDEA